MTEAILEGRSLYHPISKRNMFWRRIATAFFRWPIAPADIHVFPDSTDRASELIKEGYSIWFLGTHPTKREGLELIARPLQYVKELAQLSMVMPISLHQFLKERSAIDPLSEMTGVTAAPVANEDAMEQQEFIRAILGRDVKLGEGIQQYARLIREAFVHGSGAGIAPQGGRRKTLELDQAKHRAIEFLIRKNRIKRGDKLAFLFISMGPGYNADYEKVYDKFNIFKKWNVTFLRTITLDEMYDMLDRANEILADSPVELGKVEITLDELALIILSLPMDDNYNKIPKGYQALLSSFEEFVGVMEAIREM